MSHTTIEHEVTRAEPLPALTQAQAQLAHAGALMQLIERAAMSPDFSVERLNALLDVKERWDKNEARKAFDGAMAAAKAEIPVIVKTREVDFTSQKGRTHYFYEDLASIARAVDPILAKHGLSYRFRTTAIPSEPVTVTCIVAHRDGHTEENTLCAGRDDSGNKNSIQAIGSTLTYLQRMTLKAALGLAAAADDDGRSAGSGEDASGMPEKEFADHLAAIDSAADVEAWEKAWDTAAKRCHEFKDADAHKRLKAAATTRKLALTKPKVSA